MTDEVQQSTDPAPRAPIDLERVLASPARGIFQMLLGLGTILLLVAGVYAIIALSAGGGYPTTAEKIEAIVHMNSSTQWLGWGITCTVGALVVLALAPREERSSVSAADRSAAYQRAWQAQQASGQTEAAS